LPGATPTPSRCSSGWKANSNNIPASSMRAAVELAKEWRTDRYLRRLEAMMIVADKDVSLVLTGTGDVLEPNRHHGHRLRRQLCACLGPCSRRPTARCEAIVRKSLDIAADICVYTNRNVTIES